MTSRLRPLIHGIAAAAMLLQGLIPAGYMLGARADVAAGSLFIACPAQNDVPMAAHAGHHHDGGAPVHKHSAAGHSCAYAVAAAAVLPGAVFAPPELAASYRAPGAPPAAQARVAPSVALPPARGPPAIS